MKILVTGAAGFIGSHLVHALLGQDHTVFGVDNLSNGRFENIAGFFKSGNFVFIEDDFTNIFTELDHMDAVIHLAAVGSVPRSIQEPHVTFEHNVAKFHALLVAMLKTQCKRLVYASSSSVYGNKSPYALSKKTNEAYAEQFTNHFGLQCTGLRFFNVYGKNQRPDSPYAALIPKILSGDPIRIHAPGTQSRDFTYVEDVCSAVLTVLETRSPGVYDVGYGESRNIYELLEILKRLLPERRFDFEIIEPRAGDVLESKSNNFDLKQLGWKPLFNLEAGLKDMLYGSDK